MSFYKKLQLDPFALKQMIRKSDSPRERKQLFMIILVRSVLLVGFAIGFISVINAIFGSENSYLAVVLFCMLLSIRFVHFGYKISHSIAGLGVILLVFGLIPVIGSISNLIVRFLINVGFLSLILLLTSNEPKMGNPGLYSFSYVFLTGTSIHLTQSQWNSRLMLVTLFFALFSILFIFKHKDKKLVKPFHTVLVENGLFNKKNLWLLYYAFGVSLILQLGYLINLKRFMWVGIAFSSLISIYELPSVKDRLLDRLVGVVVGTILFLLLVHIIPVNILGIVGGIALGLCTTYRFKNIYNCFGALALAVVLFGTPEAAILRITNNFLGLLLGVMYLLIGKFVFKKINQKEGLKS